MDDRDELKRIDQTPEDAMEAQRDFAWVLIELINKSEITINKRLKKRLTTIVNTIDAMLRKRAEEYVRSNQFGESIATVNYVLLQLLLRRVPRKLLIPALSMVREETFKKIERNMTPVSLELLQEDVEYWNRAVQDETEKITATASAQKTMIRTAIKLKKEFSRGVI